MPKMKTHSGAKKRFRTTGTGKVTYKKGGSSHLLESKNSKRSRTLRRKGYLPGAIEDRVKILLVAR
jgi:large subunit ribosomal protein L35